MMDKAGSPRLSGLGLLLVSAACRSKAGLGYSHQGQEFSDHRLNCESALKPPRTRTFWGHSPGVFDVYV